MDLLFGVFVWCLVEVYVVRDELMIFECIVGVFKVCVIVEQVEWCLEIEQVLWVWCVGQFDDVIEVFVEFFQDLKFFGVVCFDVVCFIDDQYVIGLVVGKVLCQLWQLFEVGDVDLCLFFDLFGVLFWVVGDDGVVEIKVLFGDFSRLGVDSNVFGCKQQYM